MQESDEHISRSKIVSLDGTPNILEDAHHKGILVSENYL